MMDLKTFLKSFDPAVYDHKILAECFQWSYDLHYGQSRKFEDQPYFIHPVRVALLLNGQDQDMVLAGLAHDILEKTEASYDQIVSKYGRRVADLVDGVSKIEGRSMKQALDRVIDEYPEVITLRIADRIDNMKTKYQHLKKKRKAQYDKETQEMLDLAETYDQKHLTNILQIIFNDR